MTNAEKVTPRSNRFGMFTLIGLAAAVFLAGVTFDLSEKLWAGARRLEMVQFDELLLAMLVLLGGSLVIAVRRISALKAEFEAFQPTIDKPSQTAPPAAIISVST